MIKTIALVAFGFFLIIIPTPISAISPPILSSPSNNSTISSGPKLTWESVPDSVQYRVLVDDETSVKSPYIKSYYLTNTYYSPQLNPGIYYWKVGVKDNSGTWFWSDNWSFVITDSTPIPSPSITLTPSPISSSNSSSFAASDIPPQINSDQSFNVSIYLSLPNNPNSAFYLKGAFKKSDSSNYFGLTKVGADWVKNSSNYANQYRITTNPSGNWSGNLEVKPDTEDSGFMGSGNYLFKVGRYKDSDSSSVSWSNESNIEIAQAAGSSESGSTEFTPQPLVNSTNNPSNFQTKSTLSKASSVPKISYQIATVAAVTNLPAPSPKAEIKNQKQTNPFILTGIFLVFVGLGFLGYIYLRKNEKVSF